MKRLIVFAVVGPVLGMSAVCLISVLNGNWDFHDAYIPLGFFLVLATIGGLLDAALSHAPASFRMLLTSISGGAVYVGMMAIAGTPLTAMPVVITICAVCMGFCSWLSDGSPGRADA